MLLKRPINLRDESGIALVMALGIMLVLTITLTTVITFTASGARDSQTCQRGSARRQSLAEAGVNNAVAVLNANYPGTAAFPGNSALLPTRTTPYDGGSCTTPPINNCVTWGGTLTGPLVGSAWRWEWRITSTGAVRNPTGPSAGLVTRTARAVVPVVIPPTTPASPSGPLNFLYAGTDLAFEQSLDVLAPVYAVRDLTLSNSATIKGAAQKIAVGRDLYLTSPQNQIGLTGGGDPRIGEVHVVNKCSSKANSTLHTCGPSNAQWDTDKIFATVHDNVIPANFISWIPTLTCCAPYGGTIAPAGTTNPSNMGFWYQNSDLGPFAPCTFTNGTPPPFKFDTATGVADNSINLSATPTTAINLTPGASYTCQSRAGSTILGELSWNASTKLLTVKGTIFIDGSAYISPGGTARYIGQATIVLSGTFGMKGDSICASYAGACNYTASSPWDPNLAALIIVADGVTGGGGGQGQGSDFDPGDGIHLKTADFQGALIANRNIRTETTTQMQGPMISVYNSVTAGQSNDLIFPPIAFAPSGGGGVVADPPKPALLAPRNFSGG